MAAAERRAARASQIARARAPIQRPRLANPCERLEDLQRRVRAVHRTAQLGGDAYFAELDAIANELGRVKLAIAGWALVDTTTWRAAPRRS